MFTRSLSPVISQPFDQIRTVGAGNNYVTMLVIAVVFAVPGYTTHSEFSTTHSDSPHPQDNTDHSCCLHIPSHSSMVFLHIFFDQQISNVPSVCNIFISVTPTGCSPHLHDNTDHSTIPFTYVCHHLPHMFSSVCVPLKSFSSPIYFLVQERVNTS